MAELTEAKRIAFKWIEENAERLSGFHEEIWEYAETSLREYRSCAAFVKFHREEGFRVEEGAAGMPTAYVATWGKGKPVLSTYTEYDAVPETAQEPVAHREATNPFRAGHTDPHSALGVGAAAGAHAVKHAMEQLGIKGTVKIFGAAAEKICTAKPFMAARGYFDGLDACVAWHPRNATTVMYETQWGSYWNAVFVFECDEPEKWISYAPDLPNQARCPGALDAVCLMYTATKYTKEAMLPHTGLWSINEAILVAGQATADNLPPRLGIITYAWRSPSLAQQEQIYKVLLNNAEAAAKATGCKVSVRWVAKTRTGQFNKTLADLAYSNLELVGAPKFTEADKDKAREIVRGLGYQPPKEPYNEALTPPAEWEKRWRAPLPGHQKKHGSDDYVEFTWHCPTVWIQVYVPSVTVPGIRLPAWTRFSLCGTRGIIDKSIYTAGKAISGTLLDLATDPKLLKECKEELKARNREYEEKPLLAADYPTPVDLPWPEYRTTPRGHEWWVGPIQK